MPADILHPEGAIPSSIPQKSLLGCLADERPSCLENGKLPRGRGKDSCVIRKDTSFYVREAEIVQAGSDG